MKVATAEFSYIDNLGDKVLAEFPATFRYGCAQMAGRIWHAKVRDHLVIPLPAQVI